MHKKFVRQLNSGKISQPSCSTPSQRKCDGVEWICLGVEVFIAIMLDTFDTSEKHFNFFKAEFGQMSLENMSLENIIKN